MSNNDYGPAHSHRGSPRRRGWGWARVTGDSMLPTLHSGDVLWVRWLPPRDGSDIQGTLDRSGAESIAAGAAVHLLARYSGCLVIVQLPGDRPLSIKRLVGADPENPHLLWVQRDNPKSGIDSWHVGGIRPEDVLGVALARLWPRPSRLRRDSPR